MKCPICKDRELERAQVEGYPVEVDYCSTCNGMWLHREELQQMLTSPALALHPPPGAALSRSRCPRCERAMRSFYYPRTFVTAEMCTRCHGIWLDKGEFQEIDTVRRFAKESGIGGEKGTSPKPSGIKGILLDFIDVNIAAHKFW